MTKIRLLALAGIWMQLALAPAAGLAQSAPAPSVGAAHDAGDALVLASSGASAACALRSPPDQKREMPVEIPDARARDHRARDQAARGLLAQGAWGRRCYTSYGWCWLPRPAPVGYPCTCCCPLGYGFVDF
jgi:hypothetical protein